jgi:hypothetical protein
MLMRNANTGVFEFYDIRNNRISSDGEMGQVGLEWSVTGFAAGPRTAPPTQLVQAMAAFDPVGGALDNSSPSGVRTMIQPSAINVLTGRTA